MESGTAASLKTIRFSHAAPACALSQSPSHLRLSAVNIRESSAKDPQAKIMPSATSWLRQYGRLRGARQARLSATSSGSKTPLAVSNSSSMEPI